MTTNLWQSRRKLEAILDLSPADEGEIRMHLLTRDTIARVQDLHVRAERGWPGPARMGGTRERPIMFAVHQGKQLAGQWFKTILEAEDHLDRLATEALRHCDAKFVDRAFKVVYGD